ncbi:lipocalin-like domain-containing protein [Arsenicibacter rosenii]|uniref:Lipocalin-like domain-containing protein n=1 Tax=Arsenicibacter rosenii TaxID=1750698 RepID=A0A1S2VKH4_9BACT|nr:lipocalin family protein [Arsenicibacter rosenii]OIN58725.1 hypothetical protein BLX24_14320 [Arsenicibacter rosenii]
MNTLLSFNRLRSLVLMALVMTVFAVGCKQSAPEINPNNSPVEGNWHIKAMKVNPAINLGAPFGTVSDLMPLLLELSGSTCLTDLTIKFKGDGSISSDNPTSCKDLDPEETTGVDTNGRWALNGDQITLTDSDGAKTIYKATFSGNTMNWSYQEQMEDESGKTGTYTITLVFTKA